jgi:hypothetical protein
VLNEFAQFFLRAYRSRIYTEIYRYGLGIVALTAWLLSLTMNVDQITKGYMYFAMGWVGPLELNFGWYANPCIVWNIIRLVQGKRAEILTAGFGVLCASDSLFLKEIPNPMGGPVPPLHWGNGFYVWYGCAWLLLLASKIDTE